MVPMGGGYADTGAPRGLGVDDEYCAPAYCCEDTREQTSYEAMKPLGIRRRETSTRALLETSRCQERGIGRGVTGIMSKRRHDR